jgi:hypothetical protein
VAKSDRAQDREDPFWTDFLGRRGPAVVARRVFEAIPARSRCGTCAAPFDGSGSRLMRWLGRGRAHEHSGVCGGCVAEVSKHPGGAEIDCSTLRAEFRGREARPSHFQDAVTQIVLDHHGIVDTCSDEAVTAFFVPALCKDAHPEHAVAAARTLLASADDLSAPKVGIGVHTGRVRAGMTDGERLGEITVTGTVVDVTTGMAAAATGGELLVSSAAARAAGLTDGLSHEPLSLNGIDGTTDVVSLSA